MGEDESESLGDVHAHDWPLRPWLLAGLLGLCGLLIHFTTRGTGNEHDPARMALAAFLFFAPMSAALSLERERWKEVLVFALGAGLVMAGLAWRAVNAGDHGTNEGYGFGAGVVALLLALPLFQAGFHRHRFNTPYRDTHFFVWTDAVAGAGSLAFVGLSWALLAILAQLFLLLKIELLRDWMNEGWFGWTLSGVAFGAAMGTLRNQLKVLGTLQSVVLLVLSLLAVPLAAALVIFLAAVALSGLDVLWEATRSATPLLLACAAGCFVLANAIVRDDDTGMTRSPVMRIAAIVLALGILPLTVFAAVSMGLRIGQHGLTPERLWGLVAIIVACAFGIAALGAVIRGRLWNWRPFLRRANMNLAVGISALALFLALPILDFGGISASNQLGRLERGAVTAEDFDYAALKWDFGKPGERALAKLAKSGNAEIAKFAREAQEETERPYRWAGLEQTEFSDVLANLHTEIDDPELRKGIEDFLRRERWRCDQPCVALDLGTYADGSPHVALVEEGTVTHLKRNENGDLDISYRADGIEVTVPDKDGADAETEKPAAVPKVEVRPYEGRQIYIDGKPAGEPFE